MSPMDTPSISPRNCIRIMGLLREFDATLYDDGDRRLGVWFAEQLTVSQARALYAELHKCGVCKMPPEDVGFYANCIQEPDDAQA